MDGEQTMKRLIAISLIVGCMVIPVLATKAWTQARAVYQQTQYKGMEIGRLTGEVYYARMDDYVSAFMVTSEGIILVEPIGPDMAAWLKAELARRFKTPVKYVIYSHSHWDHSSGGAAFADTAQFVGHENLLKNLAMPAASTALPQNARAQDANGNGRIEREEAQGNMRSLFEIYDANKDGALSGAEVTRGPVANVRPPDLTYTDRLNLYLGGKRVEVISRPIPHADDNTIVRFVDGTNVMFASDWITVQRLPFGQIGEAETPMVRAVEAMDFEFFLCSHGALGKKADVTANIRYREELRAAVAKAIASGQTLEQAQKSVTMDAYKNWDFYEQQRPQNVAGMYRSLSPNR
jgi:glyoxylase-like metal-dependent hydrolase (beta-lactamase superfamily II)